MVLNVLYYTFRQVKSSVYNMLNVHGIYVINVIKKSKKKIFVETTYVYLKCVAHATNVKDSCRISSRTIGLGATQVCTTVRTHGPQQY